MEAKVYSMEGKETGTVTLPEELFGLPWNADLVHQVVTSMQANARNPIAHAKTRGEVRGGGKKPWQQKGTGRARHGSTRSPIWKGGGVTHGPRKDKSYAKKINRKQKQKALLVTLSRKYKDGEVIFIDSLPIKEPKAKLAKGFIVTMAGHYSGMGKAKNAALIALPRADQAVIKSFRNFGNVSLAEARNLNPVSILSSKYLLVVEPAEVFKTLMEKKVVLRPAQDK
ncbi:50S ribosomal protein L4 [Patescibacteria group bacterium]|nr:50S ribosomal protein L4 [Patescibacteria group bacterium]